MKEIDLTGKILVAMPGMGDPRFARSVIVICDHGADGAMGLIVNKPAPQLDLVDLLSQLEIEHTEDLSHPVHFGGPVEAQRGFVLHTDDYAGDESSLSLPSGIRMTATLEVLRDMARGTGPARTLVALGYAGWSPGQLEEEIADNGWLVGDASADLIFDPEAASIWGAAIRAMGIDPRLLSGAGGRA
ncbi:YqgE/AlgH family protein [Palleronia sp. LCG004]|uniref:YqgE/AlgH family protein n=1 Tax=Palleronia sp. LCG004 TaxID=3079304 RepID=UPI002941E6E4|nr:YqgE/AlgH family protein [Palleronia sp. LCG004]WOI57610.1 YqgE/AlgH family protein [Palleronia sp. LCG004]